MPFSGTLSLHVGCPARHLIDNSITFVFDHLCVVSALLGRRAGHAMCMWRNSVGLMGSAQSSLGHLSGSGCHQTEANYDAGSNRKPTARCARADTSQGPPVHNIQSRRSQYDILCCFSPPPIALPSAPESAASVAALLCRVDRDGWVWE
jgi:hypothetical protein